MYYQVDIIIKLKFNVSPKISWVQQMIWVFGVGWFKTNFILSSKKKLDTFHVVFPLQNRETFSANHCKQISNSNVNSSVIFFLFSLVLCSFLWSVVIADVVNCMLLVFHYCSMSVTLQNVRNEGPFVFKPLNNFAC